MSSFWSGWIIILSVGNILFCWWLIRWTMKSRPGEATEGDVTGHSWDGLEEYNNPLPRWWLWLFYITMAFAVIYYALYPGMGNFKGVLGWSSTSQWEAEMAAADAEYGPIFKQYAEKDIAALAADDDAVAIGRRLFLNYCSVCHGSDAEGAKGFPNLADADWLYGGTPEAIKTSIMNGRTGVMPAHAAMLDEAAVENTANYVLSMSGRDHDAAAAAEGKAHFGTYCVACHQADGTGNFLMGAPNLTDGTWLYGSAKSTIKKTIGEGRMGVMPAHADFLGNDKVHLLATYVYSLSNK